MKMPCVVARPLIVASVLDGTPLSDSVAAHRAQCLKCQAAEARAKAMSRTLRTLEPEPVESIGLAERVGSRLGVEETPQEFPKKTVAVSAVVAVATIVVVARKVRRRVG